MWDNVKKNKQDNTKGGTTLISTSTSIHGDISFDGTMHLEGRIQGNVSADDGLFTLTQSGCIEGNLCAPRIKINGNIKGNIYCSNHLELNANAVITGNVFYNIIEISKGAEINGSLEHQGIGSSKQQALLDAPATDDGILIQKQTGNTKT
ncbi:MAG: polymer-forming cytoskeletal protein [Candidatus Endonucleobacter bathymodioli]|uniref:Polymer-forming cytoskeletal protein n=1 Tax=Candidatus Endonucleibacter bathymodioli TaxID=539814 RepID=A0AA90NTY0_9GAMM|nr:polymer-forming cytoskeletal protein [Candidatus Endonucleobacter bathymodioli]